MSYFVISSLQALEAGAGEVMLRRNGKTIELWIRFGKETIAQPFPDLANSWFKIKSLPTAELNEGIVGIDETLGNVLMQLTGMAIEANKVTQSNTPK